ncbi:tetratricopeptide repeat protein [Janthinobacterium sp. GMG1]|uniref:tetratricopeptide repeat protein n=1 Tax=Janthinobacterium sp. GMG1 TaxID=3096007 RepID=UPI002ACA3691|nr:tetratricopeptide repeat protein [Janthinobacterium sp. GMG1]MDZ5636467.1 tetratricopeptide repeat protein [Janthinobacterium sp. GMG1]
MKTMLFVLSLALAQPVLAQPASTKEPRQHPALAEFDMSGLDAMRARVRAVINRPVDLSPDKVAAFDKTRAAAERGDTAAQLELAQMLHQGEGTSRDYDAGLAWMQKSAEGGYGPAQAFLGVAYTLGQGMAIDRKLGEYWSRKGAAQGVELANFTVAMHFENIHSSPEEQAHALHWLKFYAGNGFIYAYNEIGYRLMMTAQDDAQRKEAFGWYMQAAKALDPPGLNNVAYSYEVGQGVPQSDEAALGWYEMAAIAKSPPGQTGFARLLEQGRGGPTRQGPAPKPFALYLLAAQQGDREAIERLIKVYDKGELEQAADPAQAALWREKLRLAKTP